MGVAYKNLPWSQIFLLCVRADLDLIMNAECFARIDRILKKNATNMCVCLSVECMCVNNNIWVFVCLCKMSGREDGVGEFRRWRYGRVSLRHGHWWTQVSCHGLYYILWYYTIQYNAMQNNIMRYSIIIQYTVIYDIICITLYHMIRYNTIQG